MAEVLAKAEKYINGEEALLAKWENSSTQKEKNRVRKSGNVALNEGTEIDHHKEAERTESDLQRNEATSGTAWAHLSPSCSCDIHLGNSPP